jgi:hypothetical protein
LNENFDREKWKWPKVLRIWIEILEMAEDFGLAEIGKVEMARGWGSNDQ